jgi:hypothetical protein
VTTLPATTGLLYVPDTALGPPEVPVIRARSRILAGVAGIGLVAGGLLLGSAAPGQANTDVLVFTGSGFGAIPDGGPRAGPPPAPRAR